MVVWNLLELVWIDHGHESCFLDLSRFSRLSISIRRIGIPDLLCLTRSIGFLGQRCHVPIDDAIPNVEGDVRREFRVRRTYSSFRFVFG